MIARLTCCGQTLRSVDIVGFDDKGGASFAIDGLRKLSPSYGPTADCRLRSEYGLQVDAIVSYWLNFQG